MLVGGGGNGSERRGCKQSHVREGGRGAPSSRAHLHVYGAEHNSGAARLSAPAGRTERLLSALQMSPPATPRHLPLPAGWGRAGQGWQGSEGLVSAVPEGAGWGLAGLGRF